MGESITEATILKWLKNIGDSVNKDETILEISTDKVDSEIPAPESGVLVEIKAAEGETVEVKSVIAIIETDASQAQLGQAKIVAPKATTDSTDKPSTSEPSQPPAQTTQAPAATSSQAQNHKSPSPILVDGVEQTHPHGNFQSAAISSPSGQTVVDAPQDDRYYSPLVKSLAKQHNLSLSELSAIPGTGTSGRVTKKDFLAFVQNRPSGAQAPAPIASPAARAASPQAPAQASQSWGEDGTKVVPMTRMRQLIADHMVMSKATSPHVYSVAEIDVTNISKARKNNQKAFMAREGFKLSYTPFFLMAAVKGLVQHPNLNASVDGSNVILKRDINLGVAVALGTTGLIVPVIKKADQLSLSGIARSLNDLATRARSKKLKPEETQGGTFTVTNPGIFGNIIGCPIINQPQVAILATCAIKKRPVVVDGMIAVRDIIYLTLSYDHRVVDGSLSGMFLKYVTEYLEGWDPEREIL